MFYNNFDEMQLNFGSDNLEFLYNNFDEMQVKFGKDMICNGLRIIPMRCNRRLEKALFAIVLEEFRSLQKKRRIGKISGKRN